MKLSLVFVALIITFSPLSMAQAQSPFENPKDLQILPKDISPERLRNIMRGFTFALGVRCTHCHVRIEDDDGARMMFDNNEKKPNTLHVKC